MIELLQYGFMQRALIGGVLIAIICSLIGTFLVLRRLSLLGDGLAHVAFGGVAIGLLIGVHPIISALVFTVIGSLVVQRLINRTKVYGDAATALILAFGMGTAVIIIGIVKGFNVNLFSYLFGSILAISPFDLWIMLLVFAVVAGFFFFSYKNLFLITFNEDIARTRGVKVDLINSILAVIAGMTVVVAIRAVGILLISALLTIPALTALQITRSFAGAIKWSVAVSVLSVICGIILSYYLNIPASGTIVVLMCIVFILVLLLQKIRSGTRSIH